MKEIVMNQIKKDFEAVYGRTPEIREATDGEYFILTVKDKVYFPTYFRASTNGLATYVDPFTEEGVCIVEGEIKSHSAKCWYQEVV